jgi:hypothetical protein
VEFTIFDGAKISRSRVFVRTRFSDGDVHFSERSNYIESKNVTPVWNLYSYPWDEADTGSLARIVERDKWDGDNMRLLTYKGSGGDGAGDFVSYTGSNPGEIKYDAGFASWSGATNPYTPKVSTGTSLDFEPFSLSLVPGLWNDFGLPFNFPIKWADILKESGLEATPPEAWRYIRPKKEANGSVTPASWDKVVAATVLLPWQGYSIKPAGAVNLKFPILDSSRSGTPAPKVSAQPEGSWTARLEAFNSTALMSLDIGMGSKEAVFPEAPDVPGQNFRFALKRTRSDGEEAVSQYVQPLAGTWQGHWALKASASQGAKAISLRLSNSSREIPIHLVDVLHKTATPLSQDAAIQLTEADLRANDYHIVAGDKSYLDAVMDGLVPLHLLSLTNYPNPFAGATLFRYALPESFGKVEFDLKVRDFKGRTVWEKKIRGGSSLSYLWDGRDKLNSPLPAGVYTLSMQAAAAGKPAFRATRRLLRM